MDERELRRRENWIAYGKRIDQAYEAHGLEGKKAILVNLWPLLSEAEYDELHAMALSAGITWTRADTGGE
jgi:hypothetical protein